MDSPFEWGHPMGMNRVGRGVSAWGTASLSGVVVLGMALGVVGSASANVPPPSDQRADLSSVRVVDATLVGAGARAMFVSVGPSPSSRLLSPHASRATRSPSCARERVPCYPVIPIVDFRGRETALKGGQTFFELGRGLGFYYGSVRIMKSTRQRLVGWSRFNSAGWGCRNPIKFVFHRSGYWGTLVGLSDSLPVSWRAGSFGSE